MYQRTGSPNPPKQAADLGGKDVGRALLMEGTHCGIIKSVAHMRYVTVVRVEVTSLHLEKDWDGEEHFRLPHTAAVQIGDE